MEPGVANREGKGAINEKRHSQNSENPPDADHKVPSILKKISIIHTIDFIARIVYEITYPHHARR